MKLIVGGAGFLGTNLAIKLISSGERFRIYDVKPPRIPANESVDFVKGDVRDLQSIYNACKDVEVVFNLVPHISLKIVKNVLEACTKAGVSKVVYVSSSMVYGVPKFAPIDESYEPDPVGIYGKSKLEAEKLCKSYVQKGLAVTILRPKLVVGPGNLGFLTIIFDQVRRGKHVYLIGRGENRFQMIGISDIVDAIVLASRRGSGETFNIGSDNVPTVRQQIEALIQHAGTCSTVVPVNATLAKSALRLLNLFKVFPLTAQYLLLTDKDYVLDTAKAKRILGWAPKQDNIDMTISAYDWYTRDYIQRSSQGRSHKGMLKFLPYLP